MSEFDKYALEYQSMHAQNVKASGYEPAFFDEYKVKEIHRKLKIYGRKYFPSSSIIGADVSQDSLDMAKSANKDVPGIQWELLSETGPIPFPDTFDVIFIANVFHHIPHSEHIRILKDLKNHLRPGGMIFMFEHNPWNPITVKTIKDCPFDIDAVLLPPSYSEHIYKESGFSIRKRTFTLFFPAFVGFLRPLEPMLGFLPFGAQYYYEARV
jgi:SAM-dependent methyltransferase